MVNKGAYLFILFSKADSPHWLEYLLNFTLVGVSIKLVGINIFERYKITRRQVGIRLFLDYNF